MNHNKIDLDPKKDLSGENIVKLDKVEKVLLGGVPNDVVEMPVGSAKTRTAQLDLIRSFLAEQPELRSTLSKEIDEAWERTKENRIEFLDTLAERKASILSLAELNYFQKQSPQAVSQFQGELARYLVEMEGFGSVGRW